MAKTVKTVAETPYSKNAATPTATQSVDIERVSKDILEKLKATKLAPALQSEIEWCLGSYSHDKNPFGLYQTAEKSLAVFIEAKNNKIKGITAKLIADIEKAIAG
ncbi:MAG: hypothetical protein ACKODM_01145 [Cytophagales bacterium]